MNTVPERFWVVAAEPRPAEVTSVTPSTIYLRLDGTELELDRAAFVEEAIIRPAPNGPALPRLVTDEDEARSEARTDGEHGLRAVEDRIAALEARIDGLKGELKRAKGARKRLRRAAAAGQEGEG